MCIEDGYSYIGNKGTRSGELHSEARSRTCHRIQCVTVNSVFYIRVLCIFLCCFCGALDGQQLLVAEGWGAGVAGSCTPG